MIDTENILSVRTVEDLVTSDGRLMGTKVGDRVLSADADTLFPLRAALGYDMTQSLFVGEHCLLVEGSSDMLFLRWASRQLAESRRIGLDPRWTVTPVGSITKVGSFVALFGGNQLHVAVLTDFHAGEKRRVRDLRESQLLESGHVFSAERFANQEEADIGDMLGRTFYVGLVNRCYGLDGDTRLPDTAPEEVPERVVKEVEQHFDTVAIDGPYFDHMSPAVYLVEHESRFHDAPGIDVALDRFERLFKAVNDLLPPT